MRSLTDFVLKRRVVKLRTGSLIRGNISRASPERQTTAALSLSLLPGTCLLTSSRSQQKPLHYVTFLLLLLLQQTFGLSACDVAHGKQVRRESERGNPCASTRLHALHSGFCCYQPRCCSLDGHTIAGKDRHCCCRVTAAATAVPFRHRHDPGSGSRAGEMQMRGCLWKARQSI